jgi:uncharacterized MAPEG superfamily protein
MTVAIWCVLVAALLTYVRFGPVKGNLDPHAPRLGVARLDGLAARVGHIGFYLADRPPLRSARFCIGLALTSIVFIHPAFR